MTHFKSLRTGMAHFKKFEDRPWTLLLVLPVKCSAAFMVELSLCLPECYDTNTLLWYCHIPL
jgi:hypothetical protein